MTFLFFDLVTFFLVTFFLVTFKQYQQLVSTEVLEAGLLQGRLAFAAGLLQGRLAFAHVFAWLGRAVLKKAIGPVQLLHW